MTTRREQVKRALWHLEREPMPLRDPVDESTRRSRIERAVNARLRELTHEKRRSSLRTRAALLACAAAVAFVAGVVWLRGGGRGGAGAADSPVASLQVDGTVSVVHDGQNLAVDDGAPPRLAPADTLRTAAGARAHAVLASGAVVNVGASTSVRFESSRASADGAEDLALERGTIALKVPKLGPHRRLAIHTPDATVTVRGTEFTVDVREQAGRTTTGVRVIEGSVWVASKGREITLEKGSEWSSETDPAMRGDQSQGSTAASEASSPASGASAPVAAHASGAAHQEPSSTLGAENDLYQRGVSAARLGDDRKALGAFDAFLQKYQASPLAQSAEVERFRALMRLGRTDEAARRARQYLGAYPSGFARAEARALLGNAASAVGPP